MKALVYLGPKKIKIKDVNLPSLKPNEVTVKVRACGICGSDIHGFLGTTGRRIPPVIMGHEFAGVIVQTGYNVKNFKIGDRVVIFPIISCGNCIYCKTDQAELCDNKKLFGVMNVNGAMAEYINVPEKLLIKLKNNISFVNATIAEPLAVACSAVNKIKNLKDLKKCNLLVVGSGVIGLLLLQVLKAEKALKLFASDINNKKLEIAKRIGAYAINTNEADISNSIMSETNGQKIDISFEAVGVTDTVKQAILTLNKRGVSVWIGNLSPVIELDLQKIVINEIKIFGSYAYSLDDFKMAIDFLENNKLDLNIIINRIVKLEEGEEIFNEIASGNSDIIKAVLIN